MRKSVLMFPGNGTRELNPYISILTGGLSKGGVDVRDYRPHGLLQDGMVFHVHWLERLMLTRLSRRSGWLAAYYLRALSAAFDRVHRAGGQVAWTVHNIQPHDPLDDARQSLWRAIERELVPRIDTVIVMNASTEPLIRERYPSLTAFRAIPHPHYREHFAAIAPGRITRRSLGMPAAARVALMLGEVRPYKGIIEALDALAQAPASDLYLVIAGRGRGDYGDEVRKRVAGCRHARFVEGPISDSELVALYALADVALFNFTEINSSGSIMTALSLDRPVIAPDLPQLRDLQAATGAGWLRLTSDEERRRDLAAIVQSVMDQKPRGRPDLSLYTPERVAGLHRLAYGFGG